MTLGGGGYIIELANCSQDCWQVENEFPGTDSGSREGGGGQSNLFIFTLLRVVWGYALP